MLMVGTKSSMLRPRQLAVFKGHTFKALLSFTKTIGILFPMSSTVIRNRSLWCFPFLVRSLSEYEVMSSLLIDPIVAFRSWEVMVIGTWIWLSRSTRFCRCLYEAMSKPHKDMLAYVFCSCLRTSSSSVGVCWVDLFRASIRLSVSKFGGLKCLPPYDVGNFGWIIGTSVFGF